MQKKHIWGLKHRLTTISYRSQTGKQGSEDCYRLQVRSTYSLPSVCFFQQHDMWTCLVASMTTAACTICSSLQHRLAGDKEWGATPARQLSRSQSAVRGASFAEHGSVSTSNSRPRAAVTNAYTGDLLNCAVCNKIYSLMYLLTHALQKATHSCSSCKVHFFSECYESPMQILYALAKDFHV